MMVDFLLDLLGLSCSGVSTDNSGNGGLHCSHSECHLPGGCGLVRPGRPLHHISLSSPLCQTTAPQEQYLWPLGRSSYQFVINGPKFFITRACALSE
ncbi:hypothetical protein GBAR_LOCUS3357 [Geodia barretti]|uniref:Secreted protein n=1 Tax=Geodia barretti TaxID=519541 RepID=A0AA35R309_GEOBA|nr:hypothetical protein GBAR_LOCUS3357 [Geodia barretti]